MGRAVWLMDVTRPALVIGSAQPAGSVRPDVDIDVVRRRSGGGAVLLEPGRCLWVDVVLPADDRLWDDDVGRASYWLGETWAAALAAAGVGGAVVHRGGLQRTAWSALVCFAGLGPGEVTVGGRKVVGISQRRTRAAARFQCVVLAAWDPARIVERLEPPLPPTGALADVATGPGVALDALEAAFLAALPVA